MAASTAGGSTTIDASVELRLARLHLRMGQLGLARAALEALAGRGALDDEGLLALAEARWRTGDLAGAGDAAQAYLAAGGGATLALVIAAESIAAVGRPAEARRLAQKAIEQADVPLDRIFAGVPRSHVWPVDPADVARHGISFFGDQARRRAANPVATRTEARTGRPDGGRSGPGLWDDDDSEPEDLPEPTDELAAGRRALEAGRRGEAAIRFSLVLRSAPELAPGVLEATDPSERRSPEIEVVRGDAFRLVGHELDARRAYTAAAAAFFEPEEPAAEVPAPPESQAGPPGVDGDAPRGGDAQPAGETGSDVSGGHPGVEGEGLWAASSADAAAEPAAGAPDPRAHPADIRDPEERW